MAAGLDPFTNCPCLDLRPSALICAKALLRWLSDEIWFSGFSTQSGQPTIRLYNHLQNQLQN
jgi:hypothetical protein